MNEQSEDAIRLVFDFALRDGETPTRLTFVDPVAVYAAYRIDEVPTVLEAIQEATTKHGQWAAGFVSYEAASAFDPAMVTYLPAPGLPLAWFGVFDGALTPCPSPADGRGESGGNPASASPNPWGNPRARAEPQSGAFSGSPRPSAGEGQGVRASEIWNHSIAAIHQAIARGETYQVNLTRRIRTPLPPKYDTFTLYEQLREAQAGAKYTAFLDIGRFQILSTSPELFFATEGSRIVTRPMKGTEKRGRWKDEDDRLAESLARSEKDRAENVMIVDLLRNDIGKIAIIGSLHVPQLFTIERYPTVFQMTSTIEAALRADVGLSEIFQALFPCGSITGAPKINTMRHIMSLEKESRGVYCGAIGIVKPGGDAVFNVAIRTLVHDTTTGIAEYGVGGGITWDSDATKEWEETEMKAAVLTQLPERQEFDLLETMLLRRGTYFLYERHLSRLTDSAHFFQRPLDIDKISEALNIFAVEHQEGPYRVRLCVSPEGEPTVTGTPIQFRLLETVSVCLAKSPIDKENVFLYHKTTNRSFYEEHKQGLSEEIFDVLLWNEDGEVTEFTIANLVAEIDGVRWTPPQEAGLLAGTFRAELLENEEIQERTLTIADVFAASRLWLINSVRGWVPVKIVEHP